MKYILRPFAAALEITDLFLEWLSVSLKQTTFSYCQLETVFNENILATRDGSLISIISLDGVKHLVGNDELNRIHEVFNTTLQPAMKKNGQSLQIVFSYDNQLVEGNLNDIIEPSRQTMEKLNLDLDDLFNARIKALKNNTAIENVYIVIWTTPLHLSKQQNKAANKKKRKFLSKNKIPSMRDAQGLFAPVIELKDAHESLTRAILNDLSANSFAVKLLDAHEALYHTRKTIAPLYTGKDWQACIPGDKIPIRTNLRKKLRNNKSKDVSDILWPPLNKQLLPEDGEIVNLRIARLGGYIYAPIHIDLFPKNVKTFDVLFRRILAAKIPWRMSFNIDSDGMPSLNVKSTIGAILSFASSYNALINDAKKYLDYIAVNTDDATVKLRVTLVTWAKENEMDLLRSRAAELIKAVQGWGNCDVTDLSGDPFGGLLSTIPGLNLDNLATPSVAPLSDVIQMLPSSRPATLWNKGAIIFKTPEGKPWPYQPGSSLQITWTTLIFAAPGSGKSVLANMMNAALCTKPGLPRLPRIAIIDIGPSSSGLISLLKESLPIHQKNLAAYHKIKMTKDYAINPFDTQLGCRYPTPQERSFLVNFVTLLATPINSTTAYDGVSDMSGLIVDELYKKFADDGNPNAYVAGLNSEIDQALKSLHINPDEHVSWWEIVDLLFNGGDSHSAGLAQRYAVPLTADIVSMCRSPAISDLFGAIIAPTGEKLTVAFSRMISSALREYPILSQVTAFDLGKARVVSLDLDEVAKTGGEAADRQTSVMYMLARYVLAKDFYLNNDNLPDMNIQYRDYHKMRIMEIREDAKSIIFDEFHRTAKAKAVREQVIVDMREGRKWNVQITLISQSIDDFDSVMVEFATTVFIMAAGPAQAIEKTSKTFGLSTTEKIALRKFVHGPREGGGTFLAQFATKKGSYTQLLKNTLGGIELWAFSTTSEDTFVRNALYEKIGHKNARRVLSHMFPSGSLTSALEQKLLQLKETDHISANSRKSILNDMIEDIAQEFYKNPIFSSEDD